MLLWPIALLYGFVIRIRNLLFNINVLKSERFSLPVISVGNITVGGTGKTPVTEYVIRLLKDDGKLALLSRGYKRESQGVIVAHGLSTAAEIGDEPKQILDKFPDVTVCVAEKRVDGICSLLAMEDRPDIIVLDDAYQHRYVNPGLNILVVDYHRPPWRDCMLPAGELREPMNGKKRADIILISKCPENMSADEQDKFVRRMKPSDMQGVYFSTIGYQKVRPVFEDALALDSEKLCDHSVLSVTGIANPVPFEDHIARLVGEMSVMRFPDHHLFNENDIEKIALRFSEISNENKWVLTTEKDAVRFRQVLPSSSNLRKCLYYIPIEIKVLSNQQEEFKDKIITYVKQNKRNR
ncbi:tetraacyldisaccharide 4'-kinase [Saccharicrinis fermentans DSM 9555 = JCM 21142]|uniref:Tetraacyldisaccharide 4'-kinase n=2 Tax=Saccharicrinis fermentans TaxID=982 RepID=W7YM02_9BACT|nr:tetraacyldisaccharide 4'-kinase [Saccharicrinis fermentans DSM 9555 = JCM 21142]